MLMMPAYLKHLGGERNTIFGRAWLLLSQQLPQFGTNTVNNLLKTDQSSTFSTVGTLFRTFSVPSITSPHCQSCMYHVDTLSSHPTKKSLFSPFQRNIMSAYRHISSRFEPVSQSIETSVKNRTQLQKSIIRAGIVYGHESRCMRQVLSVWSGANSDGWRHSQCREQSIKDLQLSCAFPYSVGAATDVSFDGAPRDDQLDNSTVYPNRIFPVERSLKLHSGSCYLPHPDKVETGGEDAHFICVDEQAIGVADGVGGWADFGINAGHYARELMFNSASAIQDEPQGSVDPTRVLEKAYLNTKAKGSSTACIVALNNQGIHAINLGDSGFIVVRDGSTIFRSPVQQHDFNFTYQLQNGSSGDLPSSGQVFTLTVESGDVIVAGTDGLFDNLYNNEINSIVVNATRTRSPPHITAQKIAALARQRALDKNRQTPFSTAAQDAGYRYYGGKLDDITVVVSFVVSSGQ